MENNTVDTNVQDMSLSTEEIEKVESSDKLSLRNFFMFPLGTLGRDFLYNFFNGYLISFVLFTKSLTDAQFASITFIIVAARIFDAFNDPIMGGIVENTRTKWGRYKPWQLIGSVLTALVVIALFSIPVDGWGFIGMLAVAYFLFSITFTMNDISYWGMMPTLTSNPHDRNKLMSFTQLICSAGGGIAGLIVPAFTTGTIGTAIFGSAVTGYRVIAIVAGVFMVGFQLFTIFGVKEKPLPVNLAKQPPMKLKDMFKVLFKNDQLMWAALTMLLFNIGTNVYTGGLGMMYSYLEFGYDGLLWTVFGIGYAVIGVVFTVFYPWISKKFGRDKVLYSTGFAIIGGFALMLIFGLTLPQIHLFTVPFLGAKINLKFLMMLIAYTIIGWGSGFYMISVINITNTVEYNEYKTGERKEGLIFSLRPFTAKLGSALMQGIISLVYIIAGVLSVTNGISAFENNATKELISGEEKLEGINNLIASVPEKNKMILLACMCVIPIVLLSISLIIYKTKFKLNEKTVDFMLAEIAKRKEEEGEIAQDEVQESGDIVEGETTDDVIVNEEQSVCECDDTAQDNGGIVDAQEELLEVATDTLQGEALNIETDTME